MATNAFHPRVGLAALMACCAALVAGMEAGAPCGRAADYLPPVVEVDLDVAPEKRWASTASRFAPQIQRAVEVISADHANKDMLAAVEALIRLERAERNWFPEEQYRELDGISAASNVSLAVLAAINLFYDFTAAKGFSGKACTSVVTEPAAGGIIHGRNLDYDSNLVKVLKDLVALVQWKSGGRVVFYSVSHIGMVAFNTALRPGAFSLSHDERDQGPIVVNAWDIFVRRRAATFSVLRLVAQKATTFQEALERLVDVSLDAPSYFILGGKSSGEGAVVTRWRDSDKADVWTLDAAAGRWYLVETNYDHDTEPKWGDNRRAPTQRFLNATGSEHFTTKSMLDTLSNSKFDASRGERSVLNSNTIYTAVMSASAGTIDVVVRGTQCDLDIIV